MHKIALITLSIILVVGGWAANTETESYPTKPLSTAPRVAGLPAAAEQAMTAVDPEKIRAHVKFLASDLLEGRGTGARGGDIAAEYIATQFALYGLKPAGDNGSYLQKVPMVGITPGADTRFTLIPDNSPARNLKPLDEYVAYDQTQSPES